jgi:ssDNA-specific exonuclease RecJ
VSVIREHPQNHNLLFVGTERGAYFSIDQGKAWIKFKNDFPVVPVDDIAIHPRENDLIFGTHGRSIWILDDVTPLAQLTAEVLSLPSFLFDMRTAIIFNPYRLWMNYDIKGPVGHKIYEAPNPPQGAMISYYLKEQMKESVKVTIEDSSGQTIRELDGPREAGINRIIWDLRYGPPNYPTRGEMGEPPFVLPGEYKVKLSCSGKELAKTLDLEGDPRTDVAFEERTAQHDALLGIYKLSPLLAAAVQTTNHLKEQIDIQKNYLKELSDLPDSIHRQVAAIADEIETIRIALSRDRSEVDQQSRLPIRNELRRLYASIGRYTEAPSERNILKIKEMTGALKEIVEKINRIIEADVPALNDLLNEKNVPRISPGKIIPIESEK